MEKNPGQNQGSGGGHSVHHVTPLVVYHRVFGALIVGTIVTVATSYVDFGTANVLIAMLIATIKAMLVVLFFMGLKYDGQENNVTFFCSFVFLAIFVGLSSSDLFYRIDPAPVRVDSSALGGGGGEPVDVAKLAKSTPELLTKGKAIFAQQCIMCHGATGEGNGPAAATLNPPPRNFTKAEGWKNGRTLSGVFKTLSNGVQGSAMPAFATLSAEDRLALAHFVRSLGPAAPDVTAEEVAALQKEAGGPAKPHISIEKALDKVAEEWESSHH